MRKALLVCLLLTLSQSRAASLPLSVALLYPASDPQYLTGVEVREGAELALAEQQASFIRLGFEIKLKSFDDKRNAEEGARQAQRILEDPEVLMVVGAINSAVTLSASEILAPGHVAMVSPKSTNPLVTDRGLSNVNRIVPRDDAQAQVAAELALRERRAIFWPSRVSIL